MDKIKIINIDNKLIIYRKLLIIDYFDFIKLTNIKISKNIFLSDYVNNKNKIIFVGSNVIEDKIIFILIFKNNKVNKLICDPNYNLNLIMKKINLI